MSIYRIHIRPKEKNPDIKESFKYCLTEGLLGLGWRAKDLNNTKNWQEYEKAVASKNYTSISNPKYLKNNIKAGELIWTRDTDSNYYLGKVKSEWEYYSNARALKVDIVNIVRCDFVKIKSVDEVPGKVVASFRASRTLQAINNTTTAEYSEYLWNKLSKSNFYPSSKEKFRNIFSLLNSEETEDVIAIYLQMQGWLVIPNSRKGDTMKYEFYLIHKKSKERAIVQVKTGNTKLDPKEWENWKEKVFLFQSSKKYNGNYSGDVTCLEPKDINSFMKKNRDILPKSINYWIDIANNC